MNKYPFGTDQTLLVRSLNGVRQTYFPTYVGVRLIGSQLPMGENNFLEQMLLRRLNAGERWRYQSFDMYKGSSIEKDGTEHEYRKCLAPSPITSIAEALILKLLAEIPAFTLPQRAYSYRWPRSKTSGVSYQYFVEGYHKRNQDVADALKTPGSVAVVTDIRSFYPSATKGQVKSALHRIFSTSAVARKSHEDMITSFFSGLLDASEKGIPVGPSSSHVLGHLVLRDVDDELTSAYGNCYFRYVDDIVVVCPAFQEQYVKNQIKHCLLANGFDINDEKSITTDALGWQKNLMQDDVPETENFRSLTRDLTLYLAFHPGRTGELKSMLSESGFSIPVDRLSAQAAYPRLRYFLARRKNRQGLKHALDIWLSKSSEIVERAIRIKLSHEQILTTLMREKNKLEDSHKRWHLQRVRRVVNSLFYLRGFEEWPKKQDVFEAYPELVEQKALAQALSSATVNPVLPFYGRGPAAFAELWAEHGTSEAKLHAVEHANAATKDGIVSLRLSAIISERTVQEQIPLLKLPGLISEQSPSKRNSPHLTFEDELESLRLGRTGEEIAELVKTRHSAAEGTTLEALSLLSSEYRS
jgi:hypothetical protein